VSGQNSAVNSGRGSNVAAALPASQQPPLSVVGQRPSSAAVAAVPAVSGENSAATSKVNTGRGSQHSTSLKGDGTHGVAKGRVGFQSREAADVAQLQAATEADQQRLREAMRKDGSSSKGPKLVPSVASRDYPTSVSAQRVKAHGGGGADEGVVDYPGHPSAQRYAAGAYIDGAASRKSPPATSAQRVPQNFGRNPTAWSPARGSLEQYTQGLFIDGQQVLKPNDMPKVGAVDINSIAAVGSRQGKRQQQQVRPSSAPGSRAFYC
jgi:hypothetical protein